MTQPPTKEPLLLLSNVFGDGDPISCSLDGVPNELASRLQLLSIYFCALSALRPSEEPWKIEDHEWPRHMMAEGFTLLTNSEANIR